MNRLTWNPILSNLKEAYWELEKLHNRLYFLEFGVFPNGKSGVALDNAWNAKWCNKHTFSEFSLYVSLAHAYHHLNWAWNARRTPEEQVWHFSRASAKRWGRFPKSKAFSDLWAAKPAVKTGPPEPSPRKIHYCPVRVHVGLATHKLGLLCQLIASATGENSPLTEQEFARKMRRIYAELNSAWNSRHDRHIVVTHTAILRRRHFPMELV